VEDTSKFVEFRKFQITSNDAIEGAVWEVFDTTTEAAIGVAGWSNTFKTYVYTPYIHTLLVPGHLEDIAEYLREETAKRRKDNARDTVFGRD
jgi:hypothetical protein